MKLLVVVQARTNSTRLPGKVCLPLSGKPLLLRQLERIVAATTPFEVVVATTSSSDDDALAEFVTDSGYDVHRGHPSDLLDRHYTAARARHADIVVKIPSDCPLIDPAVVDLVIGRFLEASGKLDFASNLHPPSFPDGQDVEVMSFSVLETAWQEAMAPHEREHTTPFIWDQPTRFRVANVMWASGRNAAFTHRLTVDYPEDYALVRAVFERLYTEAKPLFSLEDIVTLLDAEPSLMRLNEAYVGVNWYRHHLGALATISPDETRHPKEF